MPPTPPGGRTKIAAFLKAGIMTFIDLTEPRELTPYEPLLPATGVEYRRVSIRDAGVPHARSHMTAILDAIDDALARDRHVYVYCWGGIGRTGTVVACWLRRHGRTGEAALTELNAFWQTVSKRHRSPNTPETQGQVAWVHGWEEQKPAA